MKCFGFTTGLLSGLALGILFAPDKGSITRGRINDTTLAIKEKLHELFGNDDDIDTLILHLEDKATTLTDVSKGKLLKLLREVKYAMEKYELS